MYKWDYIRTKHDYPEMQGIQTVNKTLFIHCYNDMYAGNSKQFTDKTLLELIS